MTLIRWVHHYYDCEHSSPTHLTALLKSKLVEAIKQQGFCNFLYFNQGLNAEFLSDLAKDSEIKWRSVQAMPAADSGDLQYQQLDWYLVNHYASAMTLHSINETNAAMDTQVAKMNEHSPLLPPFDFMFLSFETIQQLEPFFPDLTENQPNDSEYLELFFNPAQHFGYERVNIRDPMAYACKQVILVASTAEACKQVTNALQQTTVSGPLLRVLSQRNVPVSLCCISDGDCC